MSEVIESVLLTKFQLSQLKELFKWSEVSDISFVKNNNALIVSYSGGQYDYDGIGRGRVIYPHKTKQLK